MSFHASLRTRSVPVVTALLIVLAAGRAGAADQQKIAAQIEARNKAAIAAYSAGDLDKMKSLLAKAIALGEGNGLGKHAALAQAYLLTGVLEIDGNEDRDAGTRDFVKALRIAPDIQIPGGMSTSAVTSAFKKARADAAAAPAEDAAPAAETDKKDDNKKDESKKDNDKERRRADAEARQKDADARDREAEARQKEKEARDHEAEALARQKDTERAAKDDRDRQAKELARARDSEGKERAEKERLQSDKAERDRQLADAKGHFQEMEKERAEREKLLADTRAGEKREREAKEKLASDKLERDRQLADAKTRITQLEKDKADRDKQIADGSAREKREREAKEKLASDKLERDRQLADAKTRIAELEKDKADRDKQIADGKASEKKEREAKDRAERAYQWAETRDKERKAREDQEKAAHDKQVDGPDLPGRIPEPLYCTLPDEAPAGADLYVHCVPQAAFRPKVIAFYYRSNGTFHYNSLAMEKSRKGWYTALIPGSHVAGKQLQYYAEARDNREDVAASNGKASSPNVLILLPPAAAVGDKAAGDRGAKRPR